GRSNLEGLQVHAERHAPVPCAPRAEGNGRGQLWRFEVEQAIGFNPVSTLESVTDIHVDAPGLPITLTRSFFADTVGRYDQGPLGRGWAVADGWDRALTTEADGTVVVSGTDGRERRFE